MTTSQAAKQHAADELRHVLGDWEVSTDEYFPAAIEKGSPLHAAIVAVEADHGGKLPTPDLRHNWRRLLLTSRNPDSTREEEREAIDAADRLLDWLDGGSEPEWSRPISKKEAGKLLGCPHNKKADWINQCVKDGTLRIRKCTRQTFQFDLATVDPAVRDRFRVASPK